ncbi:hypothetical protein I317_07431 [Kwoniella heveanensis CBS 569]|uniref:Uncharacterized protein n=1 Tax=Kwoniella heveanensis BCC8398 TaxID=1296120 RepID=A0A1B9GW98_9TREE|nr:hypothetical protein I316_02854 [Kwoniella heveanensis BCC8398]OCF38775.1 hypothetical protein I317_07431 [Kwoniella heveanensis CBS 569]
MANDSQNDTATTGSEGIKRTDTASTTGSVGTNAPGALTTMGTAYPGHDMTILGSDQTQALSNAYSSLAGTLRGYKDVAIDSALERASSVPGHTGRMARTLRDYRETSSRRSDR